MRKFNYHVEVEINGSWVHAHVQTLAEAQALLTALMSSKEEIVDNSIFLNKDATDEARAEFDAYYKQSIKDALASFAV